MLDEAVSYIAQISFTKGMNPIILSPVMGKEQDSRLGSLALIKQPV